MKKTIALIFIALILSSLLFACTEKTPPDDIEYSRVNESTSDVNEPDKETTSASEKETTSAETTSAETTSTEAPRTEYPQIDLSGCAFIPESVSDIDKLGYTEGSYEYILYNSLIILSCMRSANIQREKVIPEYLEKHKEDFTVLSDIYPYLTYGDEMNFYIDSLLRLRDIGIYDSPSSDPSKTDPRGIVNLCNYRKAEAEKLKKLAGEPGVEAGEKRLTEEEKGLIEKLFTVMSEIKEEYDSAIIILSDPLRGLKKPEIKQSYDSEKMLVRVEISGDDDVEYSIDEGWGYISCIAYYETEKSGSRIVFYSTLNLYSVHLFVKGNYGPKKEFKLNTMIKCELRDFHDSIPDTAVEIKNEFLRDSLCSILGVEEPTLRSLSYVSDISVSGHDIVLTAIKGDENSDYSRVYFYGSRDIEIWYKAGENKPFPKPEPCIKIQDVSDFSYFYGLDIPGINISFNHKYTPAGFTEEEIKALPNLKNTEIGWNNLTRKQEERQ